MTAIFRLILFVLISFLLEVTQTYGQVICSAVDSMGSAYPVFRNAGLDYEDPDCEHTDFGPHVTQAYDETIDRNVFVFHSHIIEDSDRCQVQDRVRMELKGGPGTDVELQHQENDKSFYRWKFKIAEDFVGAASFNHIFQNKAKGGNDDGFPVLALTLRSDRLELRHDGGDTGQDQGVLTQVALDKIRGQWVEAYLMQVNGEAGSLDFSLRSIKTGLVLMQHKQDNVDLWRIGAEYNRPKWGMYRLKNAALQDEQISFADFCISEVDSTLCPGEAVLVTDTIAPTAPLNLRKGRTFIRSVELFWEPSSDAFGVDYYEVIQDGTLVQETSNTETVVDGLLPGSSYIFTVRAVDKSGNKSAMSAPVEVTTYTEEALPLAATDPIPADQSTGIATALTLQWGEPDNTTGYNVYLGTNTNPALVNTQSTNRLDTTLMANTTYYWRIGSTNSNGEMSSALWTFTTNEANPDAPWLVYRAEERPQIETNFYELNEAPADPLLDEVVTDPNDSGNTYYAFRSDSNDKFRWRHNFLSGDSVITIVARLQAANDEVNGISHFEIRANGWRQKVRINSSTIKLERSTDVEVNHGLDLVNEMQVIRIVSDGKHTSVYTNEDSTPLVSGTSITEDAGTYFEWGKSGGSDYGAIVDWVAIDKTGGYAPESGSPLPDDLFLSSIATLVDLRIDDETIIGFSPQVMTYTAEVTANEVPQVTWVTTSPMAEVQASLPSTAPNTRAIIEVTAQDGFTEEIYTIDFIGSSSIDNVAAEDVIIFPNPVNDLLHIRIKGESQRKIKILSIDGKVVLDNLQASETTSIDLGHLQSGAYILCVTGPNKENLKYKINKH